MSLRIRIPTVSYECKLFRKNSFCLKLQHVCEQMWNASQLLRPWLTWGLSHCRNTITHLVSDEIHVTVLALHTGKGTLLLMELRGNQNQTVRRSLMDWYTDSSEIFLCELFFFIYTGDSTLPLPPHIQRPQHNLDTKQVSFGTQQLCAPLGGSFSRTVGTAGKAWWQTHNLPNDSGKKTIQ